MWNWIHIKCHEPGTLRWVLVFINILGVLMNQRSNTTAGSSIYKHLGNPNEPEVQHYDGF